jgi:arginyl-tRNA synthetase
MCFQSAVGLSIGVSEVAQGCTISTVDFSRDIRQADQRFGDFQANSVLAYAKLHRLNPRPVAEQIVETLHFTEDWSKTIDSVLRD